MSINFKDARNVIDQHMLADGMSPVIDLERSHGSWLVDGVTGKEYLDLFSMYASMSVGYNHPYVLDNIDRLTRAAVNKPANSDIYSPQMAEFVDTVGRLAQPSYLPYSFFIEGGGLAVENALKTAFDWKAKKNMSQGKNSPKNLVIHLKDCFHGRTGYTMSLTDSPDPRKVQYFPKFNWPRVLNPSIKFPLDEKSIDEVIKLEEKSLSQIKQVLLDNPDDVACMILEPIQGEGGDNHFRAEYFKQIKQLSLENNFLLIYDEVQTGIGITGKMWAHQHFISSFPDIISFGKKTQVCGILAGERVKEVENNVFKKSSRINSTFGGSLTDMVRFKIILETIRDFDLLNNAKNNGNYLLNKINDLENEFPAFITNSRGLGLFCAFDLPSSIERDKLTSEAYKNNLLILGCGIKSIRFRPHLTVTKPEIDFAIDVIRKSVSNLLK